jgi:hypothetical protein
MQKTKLCLSCDKRKPFNPDTPNTCKECKEKHDIKMEEARENLRKVRVSIKKEN